MNALVADAENYLHVGTDTEEKIRIDGFHNAAGMQDSLYQVQI